VEVLLSGLDVSGLEIGGIHSFTSAAFRLRIVLLRVDESYQGGDLLIGTIKGRHAFIGAPVADDGADLASIHIRPHQLGSCEIRPALSAASIATMTKGTVLSKKLGTALDQVWRVSLGGWRAILFAFATGVRAICRCLRCGDSKTHEPHSRHQRTQMRRTMKIHVSGSMSVGGCLRPRMGTRVALGHSHHPLDRLKIHLADVRIVPGFLSVAQG